MRDIVVGDVHGCCKALDALLEKVKLDAGADRLILLGDLFDRGSESFEVFQRVQALEMEMGDRFVLLRGNHEDYLLGEQSFFGRLAWMRVGRGSSVRSFKKNGAVYDESAAWIRQHCRPYYMGEGFCCVHAGLKIYPPELNDSYTLFHDHELVPLNRYAGPLVLTGHIGLEKPRGVVVSVGGQIPNNLAMKLAGRGVNILGTAAEDIDRAEDRHKFSSIVDALGIDQPRWSELTTLEDVDRFIAEVGFPVLVRPSYVLSGSAMSVCHDRSRLVKVLSRAVEVSAEHPVIISKFMDRSKEIEFDAVADGGRILVSAIGEHIEYAGVHSGDATIEFPAQKLYVETVRKVKEIAAKIAAELHISGPFNIQFLANDNQVRVIECNLRASRSFPFVSKILKVNFIELATKVMLGQHPDPVDTESRRLGYVGVKSAQFSFSRLQEADPLLGVDMSSTGEVGCFGDDVYEALLKSVIAVGYEIPKKRILISSGNALQKADLLSACDMLVRHGYEILATGGSCDYLHANGIAARRALFPDESENPVMLSLCPSATDLIRSHEVDMVINIPKNYTDTELDNGYRIRRAAIDANVPLFTNARLSTAFIKAFCTLSPEDLSIKAWDEYK